jgi:hypothetical protein
MARLTPQATLHPSLVAPLDPAIQVLDPRDAVALADTLEATGLSCLQATLEAVRALGHPERWLDADRARRLEPQADPRLLLPLIQDLAATDPAAGDAFLEAWLERGSLAGWPSALQVEALNFHPGTLVEISVDQGPKVRAAGLALEAERLAKGDSDWDPGFLVAFQLTLDEAGSLWTNASVALQARKVALDRGFPFSFRILRPNGLSDAAFLARLAPMTCCTSCATVLANAWHTLEPEGSPDQEIGCLCCWGVCRPLGAADVAALRSGQGKGNLQ